MKIYDGEKVRKAAEEIGMNLHQLADAVGTSNTNMHRILKGGDMKASLSFRIAQVLRKPPAELLDEEALEILRGVYGERPKEVHPDVMLKTLIEVIKEKDHKIEQLLKQMYERKND